MHDSSDQALQLPLSSSSLAIFTFSWLWQVYFHFLSWASVYLTSVPHLLGLQFNKYSFRELVHLFSQASLDSISSAPTRVTTTTLCGHQGVYLMLGCDHGCLSAPTYKPSSVKSGPGSFIIISSARLGTCSAQSIDIWCSSEGSLFHPCRLILWSQR